MATSGKKHWPPMGRTQWPLTFLDSEDGLGLRGTIEEGRFHEVRRRARLMQSKGRILSLSKLYER